MDPVMLNTLITYISNHFYCNLEERDFFNLGVFLSLLSKEMLAMTAIRDLCEWEKKGEHHKKHNDRHHDKPKKE